VTRFGRHCSLKLIGFREIVSEVLIANVVRVEIVDSGLELTAPARACLQVD
jgi:hypothetical protein